MMMHFGMIIRLFGCLSHCDTGTFESSHQFFTTRNYSRTSKRVSTQNLEMMRYSLVQDICLHVSHICGIVSEGYNYVNKVGPRVSPESLWFRATLNRKHPPIIRDASGIFRIEEGAVSVPVAHPIFGAQRTSKLLHNMLKKCMPASWFEALHRKSTLRLLQSVSFEGNSGSRVGKGTTSYIVRTRLIH